MRLEQSLRALAIDPKYASDGFRAGHPFVVALRLAMAGFRVFPCNIFKRPLIPGWQFDASAQPEALVGWHLEKKHPRCWSVLTGREGGLWILDIDDEEGRKRLAELERKLGPLPTSWAVCSGREGGGEHRWFVPADTGPDLKTVPHAMILGERGKIDQKGHGGYAVMPGSRHQSGRRYQWLPGCAPDEVPLVSLPPEWVAALDMRGTMHSQPAKARHANSAVHRTSFGHMAGSSVLGDGVDGGGFHGPINSLAIRYLVFAGVDASEATIIRWLQRKIEAAPRSPSRSPESIARYMSAEYLATAVQSARTYMRKEISV